MKNFTLKKFYNTSLLSLSLGARKTFVSLSILFISLFWGQLVSAQRSFIPTADGSFSNVTATPAANGWTGTTQAARDSWCVSATPVPAPTGNCANVSNNWATTKTHTSATSATVSHLWRTIDLSLYPRETVITLTFKWMSAGDGANDRMRVWTVLSTYTPAQGTQIGLNGTQVNAVDYSGSGGVWTTATITLPATLAGTIFKLDFEWRNNGAVPTNIPAAIDDVTFTTKLPNDTCAGINANSTLTVNPSTTCVGGTSITEDTTSATLSQAGCVGTADDDVWFQFTAAATSHTITVTPGTMVDAVFQVFSDCGTTSLGCVNSTSGASAEATSLTGLIIGNIYYVRVHSFGSATGQGTFSICVTTPPCVAPSSQASAFTLGTITSNTIAASFTGVASANGYLVLRSTTNTAPTQPTDGTIYNAGNTQVGYTFIQTGAALTISDSGLTENTQYYYFIYAYNNTGCTGGPIYNASGALAGNGITCPSFPSAVTTASITNTSFILNWAAPLLGGSAAAITYTVQVTTDAGYATNIAGSPFTGIAALTTTISGLSPSTPYYYRILANNGCSSSYVGSNITTLATCVAPASQAGSFALGTLTSTSVPATFTGTADGYLVIQSTSVTAPTQPVNGTLYTTTASIAGLGSGLTFIQSGNSTSIPGTGLTGNTQYYYFIYAYNNAGCGGGPMYNAAGALTGNGVTCPAIPNTVTTSGVNAYDFTLNWATPTGGSASAITYTVQVTTDNTYTTNIVGSPFTGIAALTYNVTGLTGATLYYYRVLANNGCSSAYVTGSVTTATPVSYCTPTGSLNCANSATDRDAILNVTINTLNNTSACGAGGYTVYTPTGTQTTSLLKGSTYNISLSVDNGLGSHGAAVWFDFNQNGVFTDAGEYFLIGTPIAPSTTTTVPITIPVGANSGGVRMRVRYAWNVIPASTMSCIMGTVGGGYGETEDYTVTLTPPPGCTNPLAQPTVLGLTPVNTTINGTFTASASADSYLVLVSTNNTAPASPPVNLTSYTIGSTFSAGYTVVDTDGNTSFSATGLGATTLYYFYIYSMNSACTGGPLYFTTSPLTGSATTGLPSYCTPTGNLNCAFAAGDLDAIANVTINTLNNSSSCNAGGYTVFPASGTQTTTLLKGGAYNLSFTSDNGTTTSHYAGVWFDFNQNGSFADAGEFFMIGTAIGPNSTTIIPIYVPTTAATGAIRMRVRYFFATTMTSAMSCTATGTYGEVEDYTVTIATPTACNATTLACGATISGTTNGSTNYFAHGTGCTLSNFGTWYTFLGDGNQSVITVTSPVGFDTKFSVASGSCGSLTNITCVDDYTDIDLYSFNTTNGVTYYVYVAFNSAAGTYANSIGTYTINRLCGPPYNPCSSTPAISCGSVNTATVAAGYGDYNYSCGYTADGREQIYTFTPAVTGNYYISQTAGYNYIYYSYKLVSSGCNSSGWTCINGLSGVITSSAFTLTGGQAYYIRMDPETEVGGTVSFGIAGKIWSGATNTDWNTASNWLPNTSIPSATDCVIIPNVANKPIISGTNYNGLAGTLTVQPSATLTVNATNSVTVTDKVTVNAGGTFTINNSANLVQVNNVANTGNIVYKRDTSLKLYDYVYWSSPVSSYVLNTIATPLSFTAMYKWVIPALNVANSNGGQGSWQYCSGDTMIAGKGYIARAPSTFTAAPSTFNGTFTGVPNNGDISFPIERGDITTSAGFFPAAPFAGTNGQQITNLSDNWNLAGNPYPSAISAGNFLLNNNAKITGTVRLWMHGIAPTTALLSNPYYTSYNLNYDGSDYYTWNFTGASCCVAGTDLYIGAGQGFFIQMLDGARASDNVIFNNSLRSAGYDNTLFYRSANNSTTQSTLNIQNLERNRIWLDINDGAGKSNRALFGYIQGATMGNDNLYDCITNISTETQIYSLIDNSKFIIQGRSLPFNEQDEVPIGIDIKTGGTCTIGIGAVDGLFDTQNIYLKDNLLNITHDLKANPYQFTAEAGTIDDRFKVLYVNSALGNPSFTLDNNVKALVNNEVVAVSTNNLVMESIMVYNILGQKLNTYNNINANYITLSGLHKNNTTLMLKIKLQTGETVTRKVSY